MLNVWAFGEVIGTSVVTSLLTSNCISTEGNAISSVHPSVCLFLSICFHFIFVTNWPFYFDLFHVLVMTVAMPSVLWRCWLGGRKGIRPVKNTEWWGAGVVICLERGANDLHMVQLMPLPPHHLLLQQNPEGLTFWYRPTQVVLEKRPLNGGVCVCVCV